MTADQTVYEGRSKESFAQAAREAVKNAEEAFHGGQPQPHEYEIISLRVDATPGSSLSDYIVLARAPHPPRG